MPRFGCTHAPADLYHASATLPVPPCRCPAVLLQPLYGFGSRDPAKFLRVATHPELMYVRDPELNFQQVGIWSRQPGTNGALL